MIGLDSNILLRYFAQDDLVQSAIATSFIERRLTGEQPGFISLVTLAEVVWTLATRYKFSNPQIASILNRLLSTRAFVLQNEEQVFAAAVALEEGYDFADALIGSLGLWAGCKRTLTFDRQASRLDGFRLLQSA
jgi:predicted nucleic-acid-binding protein